LVGTQTILDRYHEQAVRFGGTI
ncbi:hypothetical protein RO498_01290, partial [Pseudomonas aeruginosa]